VKALREYRTWRSSQRVAFIVIVFFLAPSCGEDPPPTGGVEPRGFTAELVVGSDELDRPVLVTAPKRDRRLWIVQKPGQILVMQPDGSRSMFLDLSVRVDPPDYRGFSGLGSLAFHPEYTSNGYFFVLYVDRFERHVGRLSRFQVSVSDPDVADPLSEVEFLRWDERPLGAHHDVGHLAFDPVTGYLFVSLGDGLGDVVFSNPTRDLGRFAGKLLRLDVDLPDPISGFPYSIPSDNPLVGVAGARPEVWAYGLRNPWRFGFDRVTGDLYFSDTGFDTREEINFEPAGSGGRDYGWPLMEGNVCTALIETCDPDSLNAELGMVAPIFSYGHDIHPGPGCSAAVVGGSVYRGSAIPELYGQYLFSDFCSTNIWSLSHDEGSGVTSVRLLDADLALPPGVNVSSFGEDGFGELYAMGWYGGRIFRIVPRADPAGGP
jgi:glucose/arabinose dehydrogenase